MKIDKYYQKGRYKKEYLSSRENIYAERAKVFLKIIFPYSPRKILDAGCGDGGLAVYLKNKIDSDFYGADISERGIAIAKKRGIEAKVGDLQKKIPFGDTFFDLVMANELIEHFLDPDAFLKEVNRVLKKNGLLILGTPNLTFWFNRILFLIGIYPLYLEASTEFRKVGIGFLKNQTETQPVGHVRIFNLSVLKDLLPLYGFKIIKIKGISVPFRSSNIIISFFYKIVDSFFSLFPSSASDLIVLAVKK